jgi:ATP-binding cassette subfamily B protein
LSGSRPTPGCSADLLADHSRFSVALARTSAILTPLLELNSQFFVAIMLLFGGWRVFRRADETSAS